MSAPQPTTGGVPVSISFDQAGNQHAADVTAGQEIDVYLSFTDPQDWQPGAFEVEYTVIAGGNAPMWKQALKDPPTSLYSTDKGNCYFRLYTTKQKTKDYQVRIRVTRLGYTMVEPGVLTIQHAP